MYRGAAAGEVAFRTIAVERGVTVLDCGRAVLAS
jgi:hypothetical protein